MKNLIVELRLDGKLDTDTVENDDEKTVRSLHNKMHLNVVDLISYSEKATDFATDDVVNTQTLYNDETIVYVHLMVEPDNETFYEDEYNLLKYVADALDFRPTRVTDRFLREVGDYTQAFVKIYVGDVVDGIDVV